MKPSVAFIVAVLTASLAAQAQVETLTDTNGAVQYSSADLDKMLGPIALYPDPLLSEILPAATMPSQIVIADRYVNGGGDPNQIDSQPWDPSIKALARYPTVLKWMDDNLAWTTEVGQAFINQQADVSDAIQRLRSEAQVEGNLPSTSQEVVTNDGSDIAIEPTNPDLLYVPTYDPNTIYEDPGVYCSYGVGFPIGFWLVHDWDWWHHRVITWGAGHRPGDWHQVIGRAGGATVWHPAGRAVFAAPADRGWNQPLGRSYAPEPRRESTPVERVAPPPRERAPAVQRAPAIERAPEIERRSEPSSPGFFGGQSAREARESSSRGQQSRSGSFSSPPASRGGGGSFKR